MGILKLLSLLIYTDYLFKTLSATTDIVQKLWNLCHVLRDDGITYLAYVTELTYLLFLKMAQETGAENQIPEDCRWGELAAKDGIEQIF